MLSLKVSMLISHLPTALILLLTYSKTPPAPCPTDFWLALSFLNNLYPSRASSLSVVSGFVHDSAIPIISGDSLSAYNSGSARFVIFTILLTFANIHFSIFLPSVSLYFLSSLLHVFFFFCFFFFFVFLFFCFFLLFF